MDALQIIRVKNIYWLCDAKCIEFIPSLFYHRNTLQ